LRPLMANSFKGEIAWTSCIQSSRQRHSAWLRRLARRPNRPLQRPQAAHLRRRRRRPHRLHRLRAEHLRPADRLRRPRRLTHHLRASPLPRFQVNQPLRALPQLPHPTARRPTAARARTVAPCPIARSPVIAPARPLPPPAALRRPSRAKASLPGKTTSASHDPTAALGGIEERADIVGKAVIPGAQNARHDFLGSVLAVAHSENRGSALVQLYGSLRGSEPLFIAPWTRLQLIPRCQTYCAPEGRCLALHALAPAHPRGCGRARWISREVRIGRLSRCHVRHIALTLRSVVTSPCKRWAKRCRRAG
jgi:hypothetical protein